VVYYNALILSEALTELELRGDLAPAEVLKRVSPVAWQHINFYGRYQFDEDRLGPDPPTALVGGGFKALRHRRSLVHTFGGLGQKPLTAGARGRLDFT
jgi:hypothetical protein